jgi:hypothetical protein
MGFDFRGRPANVPEKGIYSTWGTMICIMSMWTILNAFVIREMSSKVASGAALNVFDFTAISIINIAMIAYNIYATASTRANIREYSGIGEERTIAVGNRKFAQGQDYLLSIFAMPFTIAQMGRHTASYENFEASFCTHHGLSKDVTMSDILSCNNHEMLGCDNPYTEIGNVV